MGKMEAETGQNVDSGQKRHNIRGTYIEKEHPHIIALQYVLNENFVLFS